MTATSARRTETSAAILTDVGTITVGIDGSPGASTALGWVVDATEAEVQRVIAWRMPWWAATPPAPGNPMPPQRDFFEDKARELLDRSTSRVPRDRRKPSVVACGHAGRVLTDVAARSDLLAVGSRGRSAVTEAVLGSTNSYCAAHSSVPVLIVPTDETARADIATTGSNDARPNDARPNDASGAHFVVGVDGSDNSIAALAWTIRHAATGSTIEAMHAFTPVGTTYELAEFDAGRLEDRVRSMLASAVARAMARTNRADRDYELRTTVTMADARAALVEAGGDVIVVGARGHRGLAHLVLGSVATALTHRTTTPTIIVPSD